MGLAILPGSLYINGSLSADWTAYYFFSRSAEMAGRRIFFFLTNYNKTSVSSDYSEKDVLVSLDFAEFF